MVPPILVFLAKSSKLDQYDFSYLRLIVTGAAPVGEDLCEELHRRFPQLEHVVQGKLMGIIINIFWNIKKDLE